jgi:hypothetical protein
MAATNGRNHRHAQALTNIVIPAAICADLRQSNGMKTLWLDGENTKYHTISYGYNSYAHFVNWWHTRCKDPLQLTIVHQGGGS